MIIIFLSWKQSVLPWIFYIMSLSPTHSHLWSNWLHCLPFLWQLEITPRTQLQGAARSLNVHETDFYPSLCLLHLFLFLLGSSRFCNCFLRDQLLYSCKKMHTVLKLEHWGGGSIVEPQGVLELRSKQHDNVAHRVGVTPPLRPEVSQLAAVGSSRSFQLSFPGST